MLTPKLGTASISYVHSIKYLQFTIHRAGQQQSLIAVDLFRGLSNCTRIECTYIGNGRRTKFWSQHETRSAF